MPRTPEKRIADAVVTLGNAFIELGYTKDDIADVIPGIEAGIVSHLVYKAKQTAERLQRAKERKTWPLSTAQAIMLAAHLDTSVSNIFAEGWTRGALDEFMDDFDHRTCEDKCPERAKLIAA
jgi:hypothetical protein